MIQIQQARRGSVLALPLLPGEELPASITANMPAGSFTVATRGDARDLIAKIKEDGCEFIFKCNQLGEEDAWRIITEYRDTCPGSWKYRVRGKELSRRQRRNGRKFNRLVKELLTPASEEDEPRGFYSIRKVGAR